MLLLVIITLVITIPFASVYLSSIFIHRIAYLIILFSGLLSYNTLYVIPLSTVFCSMDNYLVDSITISLIYSTTTIGFIDSTTIGFIDTTTIGFIDTTTIGFTPIISRYYSTKDKQGLELEKNELLSTEVNSQGGPHPSLPFKPVASSLTRNKAFKGIHILVTNIKTGDVFIFLSKSEAALAYNISIRTLSRRCKDSKPFEYNKELYTFSISSESSNLKQTRLSEEDRISLSKDLKSNTQLLSLITGMQLGDSHISLSSSSKNARIHILQKDKEFVEHIWNNFNSLEIVNISPLKNEIYDNRTNKTYTRYLFASIALPYFTELHKEWYKEESELHLNSIQKEEFKGSPLTDKCKGFASMNKRKFIKVIPSNIVELLTPRALAYWIASDGSYHKINGSITLYTNSFSLEEIHILKDAIFSNFNIKVTINKKKLNQYTLRFSKYDVPRLREIIFSDLPPSLLYRIGL